MHNHLNLPTQGFDIQSLSRQFDKAINATLEPKLDALVGKAILFNSDEKEVSPLEEWGESKPVIKVNTLPPISEPAVIAAIDSSCIFIGETVEGSIYAAKAGLALAYGGKSLMHLKMGPILFYINETSLRSSSLDQKLLKFVLFDIGLAKRMIRLRIERVIQNEISRAMVNGLILIDGSLKRSSFEHPRLSLTTILETCESNNNKLIGLSKTTSLKVLDHIVPSLARSKLPSYVDVSQIVKSLVSNIVGKSLLAKLSSRGLVLRADVWKEPTVALGKLISNDAMPNGYPETLRLAHHLSVFTQTETTCLQGFILSKFAAREVLCEDVRRTLLGTFS